MNITNDSCCEQDICCSGTGTEIPDTVFDFNVSNALTTRDAYVSNKLTVGDARITNAVVSNLLVSENIRVSNLSVTGNFYVTATNTTTTNSFTIDNTGTTTALIVRQTEPTVHTHNVAEFYDATTPALIIDPEGNLAIHTTVSPNYALTLVDGASFDVLTIRGNPPRTSLDVTGNVYASNAVTTTNVYAATQVLAGAAGVTTLGVTGNVYASNAVTTTNVIASSVQLASSTITVPSGTLQFNSTAGIYNATIGSIRGIIPATYIYVKNTNTVLTTSAVGAAVAQAMFNPMNSATFLPIGKYYLNLDHVIQITTGSPGGSNIYSYLTGTSSFTTALTVVTTVYRTSTLISTAYVARTLTKESQIKLSPNLEPNTLMNISMKYTGTVDITVAGSFTFSFFLYNPTGTAIQSGVTFAGSSAMIQPLGVTGADINIGGWS